MKEGRILGMRESFNKILWIVLAVLVLAALAGSRENVERLAGASQVTVLNDRLEKRLIQGEAGSYYEYSCRIPKECQTGQTLSVEYYWSAMRILLDGEEIHRYEDPYAEKGVNRQWIDLPEGCGGGELVFRGEPGENLFLKSMEADIYIGGREAIYLRFLYDNGYALLFGGIAAVMGAVLGTGSIFIRKHAAGRASKGIRCLAAFVFTAGIWMVSDSKILQLVTGRTGLISLISFLSFLIMPVFLIYFIEEMMLYKNRVLKLLCLLYLLNSIICLALKLLRLAPLHKTLITQHILILCTVILIFRSGWREIYRYGNYEMKRILAGFGVLAGFALAALFCFYRNLSGYSCLYGLGLIGFMVCLADAALQRFYYYLKRGLGTAMYRRLAYTDSMTCMGNRAAFEERQEKDRRDDRLAYIMLDINNLKQMNDSYGHQEGDRLIMDMAECIRDTFERIGSCFRIGGDEFVVILKHTSAVEIERALRQLDIRIAQINQSRRAPGEMAYGYAGRWEGELTPEQLLGMADERMYEKKRRMKGQSGEFDNSPKI